jgi:mannose-6-phosphate isomerase
LTNPSNTTYYNFTVFFFVGGKFWIGTHISGPSKLKENNQILLKDYISLSSKIFGSDKLVYLAKALSISIPLSIQAHPDKELALSLHNSRPDIYPDSNHKPEMAISLTPFEALYGFRPVDELKNIHIEFPELKLVWCHPGNFQRLDELNDKDSETDIKKWLKNVVSSLLNAPDEYIKECLKLMIGRIENERLNSTISARSELVLRINSHFPGDVGVFVSLLMNHVCLSPGEALFMGANEIHAYLSGGCLFF